MRAVGSAFTAILLRSSEQDLASTNVLCERFVNELAKQELVIISLPRSRATLKYLVEIGHDRT